MTKGKKKDQARSEPGRVRRAARKLFKWLGYLVAVLVVFSVVQVAALRFIDPPFSAFMLETWVNTGFRSQIWIDWRSPAEISPNMARAVLASEDQRFYDHGGFDWVEVKKAVREHTELGKSLRGASTITMQVARNMFLWPGRSWVRKGLEAYYTVLLELFIPKKRILEIYLNTAQFGPSMYGVQAASRTFYGRDAANVTRDQAARLVVQLPAPSQRRPFAHNAAQVRKKAWILKHMDKVKLENWN